MRTKTPNATFFLTPERSLTPRWSGVD